MAVKIQLRRGTTSDWSTANTVLSAGEVGVNTTTSQIKVGNGSTAWNSLSYFSSGTITQITASTGLKLNTVAAATSTGGVVTLEVDTSTVMMRSVVNAIGQVVVGGGASSPVALPAGTNNYVLVADSTNTTYGVKWAPVDTNLVTSSTFVNNDISSTAGIVASKLTGVMVNGAGTANATITISASAPSGGSAGDIWFKY